MILARILALAALIVTPALAEGPQVADGAIPAKDATAEGFDHVSCRKSAYEVRLTVTGVKDSIGLMTAELYRNDKDNFLQKEGRISKTRFAARAPATQFCIEVPEPGQYAIVVYHDENANQHIDKGAFGIPKEPWAISNNPPIRFGPPSVEDSLITVADNGANLVMTLNN